MRIVLFVIAAALAFASTASAADEACCGDGNCCATAACCGHNHAQAPQPTLNEWPTGVREYATVKFFNPVWVGDKVLMGEYLIEHDTERMARGEPCTYIYDAKDRRHPVVAFHCRHLVRPPAPKNTVTLVRSGDVIGGYRLTEFQFAGTTHAHGVPDVR